jgi:hypothetical protein
MNTYTQEEYMLLFHTEERLLGGFRALFHKTNDNKVKTFLRAQADLTEYWEHMYALMYTSPMETLPLMINSDVLGTKAIIKWRLQVGR